MVVEILFVISGFMIALLILAKVWEGKRERPLFLLSLISRGDERVRVLSQRGIERYSVLKEEGAHFVQKQLPLQMRSFATKVNSSIEEKYNAFLEELRGSRLIKKDGMSEFMKNISEKEEGRIDDELEHPDPSRETR